MFSHFMKNHKQSLSNYLPISRFPIWEKYLNVCYITRFYFFHNKLSYFREQSLLKPRDSNQLLPITRGIYTSFDGGYEVQGVFLGISKALDKVWHERSRF